MGQVLKKDKIGSLSEAGGTVTLGPSSLTIGGQQYTNSTSINLVLPALSANTRYQIYAIRSAGNTILITSTNENSIGPAGADSWKLVGSFLSSGTSVFGNFLDIKGRTDTGWLSYTPTINGFGAVASVDIEYRINKSILELRGNFTAGTTVASETQLTLPNSYDVDSSLAARKLVGYHTFGTSGAATGTILIEASNSYINFGLQSAGTFGYNLALGNSYSSGQIISFFASVPLEGLTSEIIEDL